MGFSHRVMFNLFTKAELKRRLDAMPVYLSQLQHKNKSSVKRKTSFKTSFIESDTLIHLIGLIIVLKKSTEENLFGFPVSALLIIGLVTLFAVGLQTLATSMDFTPVNCVSFSVHNWKPVIWKILAGTKRNFFKMEDVYLKMKTFSLLINQLVFFCLCERAFLLHQPVVSLYTLMFFNVIAYCVSYIKELIEREDWSLYVNVTRGSNVRHLAMSSTKIVLEWTKAITFIITVVFILLVFGLEKGLKNYSPGVLYLTVTGVYYMLSEKVFVELICMVLDHVKFDCFENMESLYSPVILKGSQIILSVIFTVVCGLLGHFRITILSCFTNIRVQYKDLENIHWKPLRSELVSLLKYRNADREELVRHDDVCPVCLLPMKTARVTPCHHLFHADCLRKCLTIASRSCPICKQDLPSLNTI